MALVVLFHHPNDRTVVVLGAAHCASEPEDSSMLLTEGADDGPEVVRRRVRCHRLPGPCLFAIHAHTLEDLVHFQSLAIAGIDGRGDADDARVHCVNVTQAGVILFGRPKARAQLCHVRDMPFDTIEPGVQQAMV